MIPIDLNSRPHLIKDSLVQAPRISSEITGHLPDFAPGQRVFAKITAALGNGSFRAEIDGKTVSLNLVSSNLGKPVEQPSSIGPGQTLELVVTGQKGQSVEAQRSTDALRDRTDLSKTAKVIGDLLTQGETRPAQLAKGTPILGTLNAESFQQLPDNLKQAVSSSGLFYEAHQAQWFEGKLPLSELLKEPQGQLSSPATLNAAAAQNADKAANTAPAAPNNAATAPMLGKPQDVGGNEPLNAVIKSDMARSANILKSELALLGDATSTESLTSTRQEIATLLYQTEQKRFEPEEGKENAANGKEVKSQQASASAQGPQQTHSSNEQEIAEVTLNRSPTEKNDPLPSELQPLVKQQLEAAENGRLFWEGQIWPGQTMEWSIEEDGQRNAAEDDNPDENRSWKTSLRLVLPNLGEFVAKINLNAKDVSMQFNSEHSQLLRSSLAELSDSLQAVGLNPQSILVSDHGSDQE